MTVPRKLIGAWRRTGLIIDGLRQVDYCDVLWLQSADWFADIRLPLDPVRPAPSDGVAGYFAKEGSFAGLAHWSSPMMTWEHLIDVRKNPQPDSNHVHWQNGGIIERGTKLWNAREVPWAEEWIRLTDDSVEPVVEADDRHVHIVVGDWAIKIEDERPHGNFLSVRHDRIDGEWREVGSVRG
ncbi:hypothetical protein AB0L59_11420 [Streptomyces sp. NPDC052109]|uniref:hypothetical protein n=1 Tax=Streptomyces sp. NPDC052109 TaxID=3155527 RepID=UPI0034258F40